MTPEPGARRVPETDPRLASFLEGLTPIGIESARWPTGDEYELISYFTPLMPPVDVVMSVRGVVMRDRSVLVYDDDVGPHIIPGGRVEPGETALVTLARELREEIGCEVHGEVYLMGFIRLHHLGPRRPEFRYPYPDNVHLIYFVRTENDPRARTEEPLVLAPRFVPLHALESLALPPSERAFLDHPLLKS